MANRKAATTPVITEAEAFRMTGAQLRSASEAGSPVATAELARRKANRVAKTA